MARLYKIYPPPPPPPPPPVQAVSVPDLWFGTSVPSKSKPPASSTSTKCPSGQGLVCYPVYVDTATSSGITSTFAGYYKCECF